MAANAIIIMCMNEKKMKQIKRIFTLCWNEAAKLDKLKQNKNLYKNSVYALATFHL